MPLWTQGLFLGVLLGSVLSTFNSALNSASTMFSLEIYKIYIDTEASNESLVKVGGIFGIFLTLGSFFIGILTTLPDALAAKSGFVVGFACILCLQLLNG